MVVPAEDGPELAAATADPPPGLLPEACRALGAEGDWAGMLGAGQPAVLLLHRARHPARSALAAWRAASGRDWDAEDLAVLRSMAAMLGAILGFERMQQELERQAATDALTGLANRRAFLEALQGRIAAAEPGALVFLDLDNLKPLNDAQGHEAGDAALRATGRMLRDAAGPQDLAARFGGDEFVAWLHRADAAAAVQRAEALLRAAAALPQDRAPRFSLGIAAWDPAGAEGAKGLLARADAALYEAKRNGRGGWCLAKDAA
jgi:diguanylate cyclase (GGDEF)-like protein